MFTLGARLCHRRRAMARRPGPERLGIKEVVDKPFIPAADAPADQKRGRRKPWCKPSGNRPGQHAFPDGEQSASTGRGGIGNRMVFPVSRLGRRNGSRALVPPAPRLTLFTCARHLAGMRPFFHSRGASRVTPVVEGWPTGLRKCFASGHPWRSATQPQPASMACCPRALSARFGAVCRSLMIKFRLLTELRE